MEVKEIEKVEEVVTPVLPEEEPIPEEIAVEEPEEVKENKKRLAEDIVKIYTICYKHMDKTLEGKSLKKKFEQIETSLRKYRKKAEESLKSFEERLAKTKIKYDEAVENFEKEALEKLDPTRYETDVAPVELEYLQLKKYCESKAIHVQNIRHLTTKMFAREKTVIPTIKHSQAILLSLLILKSYMLDGTLEFRNVDNEEDVKTINEAVASIMENPALVGEFTEFPSMEDFIKYFNNMTECKVDKSANKAKEGKEQAFRLLKSICEDNQIIIPEPEAVEGVSEQELELIKIQNQIKVISEAVRKGRVKNPDGTISEIPKSELPKIMECIRAASLFLNGDVMALMDEKMLSQLPFREQGLSVFYNTCLKGLSEQLVKDRLEDPNYSELKWKMLVSWTFLSTSVVDTIPTMLLMM